MLGDPSGLTDTMWDLIVDTLGAVVIGLRARGKDDADRPETLEKPTRDDALRLPDAVGDGCLGEDRRISEWRRLRRRASPADAERKSDGPFERYAPIIRIDVGALGWPLRPPRW